LWQRLAWKSVNGGCGRAKERRHTGRVRGSVGIGRPGGSVRRAGGSGISRAALSLRGTQ